MDYRKLRQPCESEWRGWEGAGENLKKKKKYIYIYIYKIIVVHIYINIEDIINIFTSGAGKLGE